MLKPRPLGGLVHSKEVGEVLDCGSLHIMAGWALGEDGIGSEAIKSVVVLVEDVSGLRVAEAGSNIH